MKPYYRDEAVAICLGDCREVLPKLRPVDAIVTDPPYGLGFMGQEWDKGVPGVEFWSACLRALKPGGHLLAFGGTRTHHRLWCAIEDAGFEVRDTLMWLYGSGFPKSLDISAAIDKAAKGHPQGTANPDSPGHGKYKSSEDSSNPTGRGMGAGPGKFMREQASGPSPEITDPAAKQWEGFGTALKPSWEPILLARKPLEATVAENVLKYGVGGLNIDGCRVMTASAEDDRRLREWPRPNVPATFTGFKSRSGQGKTGDASYSPLGRWPANVLLDEEAAAQLDEQSGHLGPGVAGRREHTGTFDFGTAPHWGGYADTGGASRFFYVAKASRAERERNVTGLAPVSGAEAVNRKEDTAGLQSPRAGAGRTAAKIRNPHPTVKPLALMRWLVLLVTPPNGVVLDPFMGSGSTLRAAKDLGRKAIGIEIEERYCQIAAKRMAQTTLGLSL